MLCACCLTRHGWKWAWATKVAGLGYAMETRHLQSNIQSDEPMICVWCPGLTCSTEQMERVISSSQLGKDEEGSDRKHDVQSGRVRLTLPSLTSQIWGRQQTKSTEIHQYRSVGILVTGKPRGVLETGEEKTCHKCPTGRCKRRYVELKHQECRLSPNKHLTRS